MDFEAVRLQGAPLGEGLFTQIALVWTDTCDFANIITDAANRLSTMNTYLCEFLCVSSDQRCR